MIQKVFLDTNVIVDLIINREPFVNEAEEIFTLKEGYNYDVIVSALTIANLAYVIDQLGKKPRATLAKLMPLVNVVDLSSYIIEKTLVSIFEDFEDRLQHASALFVKADVIVTRMRRILYIR